MRYYYIGLPEGRPRIVVSSLTAAEAIKSSEEVVLSSDDLADYVVSADGESLVPSPIEAPTSRIYSFNEWVDLWSLPAQVAISGAAMTNPLVKLIYDRAMSAAYIDADDPRTAGMVQLLADQGVVSQADADAVMAA